MKASSNDGLWNGPETTLAFQIEPALWQTGWFRELSVVASLLVLALLYRLRMYQLTRQLNARFQERLAERTHIARDFTRLLLQGFVSASMQLDVAEDQLPDDSPVKPKLGRILQLMRQVNEEGREALFFAACGRRGSDSQSLELVFSHIRQELGISRQLGIALSPIASPGLFGPWYATKFTV